MSAHLYPPPMTLDEYLRVEEASPERHEYVAGEVYLLSGVSTRHNQIAGRIYAALLAAGGPCRAFFADVKLRADDDRIYYPDVMATCEHLTGSEHVVTSPTVLVEVTSPSTRRIDRVEKLAAYRQIGSLRTYLVVAQDRRVIEHHWRDHEGTWQRRLVTNGTIVLAGTQCVLVLDDVYCDVVFTEA